MRLRNLLFIFLFCISLSNCPFDPSSYGAWQFDGTDNVTIADNAVLTFPDGDWAASIWIEQTTNSAYGARAWEAGESVQPGIGLIIDTGSGAPFRQTINFWIQDDDTSLLDVSSSEFTYPTDNGWHNLIVVRSGSTFTVYLDGSATDISSTDATINACNIASDMHIGNRGGGVQDRTLIGSIAEFAIWHRGLSIDEIVGLAAGFVPNCYPSGLVLGSGTYVSMIGPYQELVNNLLVTNTGTTQVAHPRMYYCGG